MFLMWYLFVGCLLVVLLVCLLLLLLLLVMFKIGLRQWREKLAGNIVLKLQASSISAPLDCPARGHFTRTSS